MQRNRDSERGNRISIIKIEGISESYLERMDGILEWHTYQESKDYFCDLYEVEAIMKSGKIFSGMTYHLVHYPGGTVYSPFELKENIYVEQPVWDEGKLSFLGIDFFKQKIQLYRYFPESQKLEMIRELPLGIAENCYNLALKVSLLMPCRDANNKIPEIVWPEDKRIEMRRAEDLLFRGGGDLYSSERYEDSEYYENVIIRDLSTGKIKEKHSGYLIRLLNGVRWKVSL